MSKDTLNWSYKMIINQTSEIVPKLPTNTLSSDEKNNSREKNNFNHQGNTSAITISKQKKQKKAHTKDIAPRYLRLETIRKILNKFFIEKKATEENILKTLNLTHDELELILNNKVPQKLIAKINLPLIKLLCETKFND